MYHIEDWKPLPRDIESKSTWTGHSKICAVDTERGLVVRWVSGSRDIYRDGWLFQHGRDLVQFETYEHWHEEDGSLFSDLRFTEFGYSQIVAMEYRVGNFVMPAVETQQAWRRLAAEGVLVFSDEKRRKFRSTTRTRVILDGVPLTLSDFGYPESVPEPRAAANPSGAGIASERLPRQPDAATGAGHSATPQLAGSAAVSLDDLRGLGTPPGRDGTIPHEATLLHLENSFLMGGGLSLLNDVRVVPANTERGTLSALLSQTTPTVTRMTGEPVPPAISADAQALWESAAGLVDAAHVWLGNGRNMVDIPLAQAATLLELLIVGDVSAASVRFSELARRTDGGRAVSIATLGFVAAILGRAPVGWIPFAWLVGGNSVGSPRGRIVISHANPALGSLLNHWIRELQSRVPIDTSPDPQDPAMRRCLEGLVP